jgi:aconitate hydratase
MNPETFKRMYDGIERSNEAWNRIPVRGGQLFDWQPDSTYIQEPPFFIDLSPEPPGIKPIEGARVLVMVGDSVTTDHISPAGSIAVSSPAGQYLIAKGVPPQDFNSYGARRGNDQVMVRGTFANIRLKNRLAPGTEGGYTTYFPTGELTSIFDASLRYQAAGTPLLVLGGRDYGMGSSRDWAAKGTYLLGVKAVIAQSFERIHRGNLVGMGVLPLTFKPGESAESLGLSGREQFTIRLAEPLTPQQAVTVSVRREDGRRTSFTAICRLDTPVEIDYYRQGGILPTVLRSLWREKDAAAL